ncbi:eight-cysteine-cluster domain-containing protein [Thermococcus indicus]|uniref:Eight-cysteine-cluster domain-containing protein n=1 Tax=Thermococcus indicus TaxID=2586643 RepID=A0A4Y5SI14_9EURY|nr:CGP-CTERM-anchored Cys-rich protein [Thermococcus indicus]QDA30396.1 eight-cysteine-cluster domain-containing protein [Thermococcus indicus]
MKRALAMVILLMFTVTPLVRACMTPADSYAVEVVLNKPGITSELWRLEIAHHVLIENDTFVFRSHYDKRLYVLVWNASDGLHIKVGIPVEWKTEDVSMGSLNVSLLITPDVLERLKDDGWRVSDNTTFERKGVKITLLPVKGSQCTSDADCATGGCSGEVCAPKEEAPKIVTPCVYKPWYDCLSLTSCGCLNGLCTWKPDPAFETCLREHGIDPSRVVRAGYFELKVEAIDKSDDEVNVAVKDFLGAFGVSCNSPLTLVETAVTRLSPAIDPSEVNASEAIKAELEWMKEPGIVNLSERDVGEISTVAQWGFAGHNGRIGWYEGANGSYAWMPYYRSRNPSLIKCVSNAFQSYNLPNGTAYVGPTLTKPPSGTPTTTSGSTKGEVCGPGIVALLALLAALGRR